MVDHTVLLLTLVVLFVENLDLCNIHTPVIIKNLERYLNESGYDKKDSTYLLNGFTHGFDLEYEGPRDRRDTARNLPFRVGVGNLQDLWDKVMKEIHLKRFAGPFDEIPFQNYVQSPIGLVPKAGNKTRLIFHLSYDFKQFKSVNYYIPHDRCTVRYRDLDHAVNNCLKLLQLVPDATIWLGIADLESAFRLVAMNKRSWSLLVMKARNPESGIMFYFIDKCMPFGSSISCAIFQKFSNALHHIVTYKMLATNLTVTTFITNYLDDFLFIAILEQGCYHIMVIFHETCKVIGIPVAENKTRWPDTEVVFLAILINGISKTLSIPEEKRLKAVDWLRLCCENRKVTVKQLQSLAGLLNFLHRAIYPGRAFTRRIYAKISGRTATLKPHHHVRVDTELKSDCGTWLQFLQTNDMTNFCRPFIDLNKMITATDIKLFSDSSANLKLGFGGVYNSVEYFFGQWEVGYIKKSKPSIEYLELYAVCIGLTIWIHKFPNCRILLHCDNMSVVSMINKTTSGCRKCMSLIRYLVLLGLKFNTRVFAQHILGVRNELSDSLSRLQFGRFWDLAPSSMMETPQPLPQQLWPASKIWNLDFIDINESNYS